VEPIGNWGKGSVRLAQLPTRDEYLDNIVAFWTPAELPPPGEPIEFEYWLHWFLEPARRPAGSAVATHHHRAGETHRFLVDFAGEDLSKRGADAAPNPVVSAGAGAEVTHTSVQKNPYDGSWRVTFTVKSDGRGRAVELRCFLRAAPHVLTETWSYLWQP
jgi:glucans biosynthesis protein